MIDDPRLASIYAMNETDPTVLESVFAYLLADTPEAESRETARLLRSDTRDTARTNAIPRLTRAKRYLDDAATPLATLAGITSHTALTHAVALLADLATTFQTAATALATRRLEAVLTDTTVPTVPTTTELQAALEGLAGTYALASHEPDPEFAAALPIYRDAGALATTLTATDPADLADQWRALALLLTARAARGTYEAVGAGIPEPYTHDTRLFIAALLAARGNQLEVRRKLGVNP